VYVIEHGKVLLHFHAKHQKWLPPGGHLEANETPVECALREVLEETGLRVELIRDERIWIDAPHAKSCERPFMCLIESIPAHKDVPAHEHIDFIYVARPLTQEVVCEGPIHWFTLDEVLQLMPGKDIFEDTIETIRYLLA
jgi:8-oxo-dGTP pyrophosphatase MutT (NUDIX family)